MCQGLIDSQNHIIKSTQNVGESFVKVLAPETLYKSDQTIRFTFEQNGFLEPGSVYLAFNVVVNAPLASLPTIPATLVTPTTVNFTFTDNISNVFNRVRLMFGRTCIIEDIQEYGLLQSIFSVVSDTLQDQVGTDALLQGKSLKGGQSGSNIQNTLFDKANYHNINNAGVTPGPSSFVGNVIRRYILKVNLGLLQQKMSLPLFLLNDELILEFTVNKLVNCAYLQTCPVNGNSAISEVPVQIGLPELFYSVKLPNELERQVVEASLMRKPMSVHYTSFSYHNRKLNGFQRNHTLRIPLYQKRLLYALAVIRNEDDRRTDIFTQDPNNFYISLDPRVGVQNNLTNGNPSYNYYASKNTALVSYQWFYNNTAIPEKPVSVCEPGSYQGGTFVNQNADAIKTGVPVEAMYYLKETLGQKDKSFNVAQNDVFGYYDSFTTSSQAFNQLSNLATNRNATALSYQYFRTYTSAFVLAGKFYSKKANNILYTLDGNSLNTSLTLNLNFANAFQVSDFSNPPPMSVDIFLAYDSMVTIDSNRTIQIDS